MKYILVTGAYGGMGYSTGEELRSELKRVASRGHMLFDRTESRLLMDFF